MNRRAKGLGTLRINNVLYRVVANLGFDQLAGLWKKTVTIGMDDNGQTHTVVSKRRDQGWRIQD